MLHIDPELLSTTSQSPSRAAAERGYRWLRFEPALEKLYRLSYMQANLLRMRLACYLALLLFALFVLIDLTTLPSPVSAWTASIRFFVIMPSFLVALAAIYRESWRAHLDAAVFLTCLVTGLGTVAVIGAALRLGTQIPYEGILLVAVFIYLISGLPWWRALLVNMLTLLAFVVMEALYQDDPWARLYQIVYMLAANAVGAYGGYFLEYSTRTTFLVHALLNELAERDGLTGLYNRRALNSHLDRVWRQALRDERVLAIAMIDVDKFKQYNDRYGHATGDAALKTVARAISGHARRPLDFAARYGGEEFAVVWYHPAVTELAAMGEQLRAAVVDLGIAHADSLSGKLSVSVGIALVRPVAGQLSSELLRAADLALYQAKNEGRDRVVVTTWPRAAPVLSPEAPDRPV